MSKLKLPEQLESWKVISALPDKNGFPAYRVGKTEFDGSDVQAVLTHVCFEGEDYNGDSATYLSDEAAFVKSVINLRGVSNYIDACVENVPSKNRASLYILTEELPTLAEVMSGKPTENEIVDFGLSMSGLLEKLESANMFHGNLKPENIYMTDDGCKLGGFTEFESSSEDLSFTAPEIYRGEQPDYTTDIYSLGLIMYSLANGGRLPFEGDGTTREQAVEKRMSGASVTAPAEGGEKLKSVIVIACQPDGKNRWKNAGNLKNALASIKSELLPHAKPKAAVKLPENTSFDSNVFEEYAFDEFDEVSAPEQKEAPKHAAPVAEGPALTGASRRQRPQASAQEPGDEMDNRVFDDYKLQTKVFNIKDVKNAESKDFGEYFDDEPAPDNYDDDTDYGDGSYKDNAFYRPTDDEDDDQTPESGRRKGPIIAFIIALVLLAALVGFGVYASQNNFFGWFDNKDSQTDTAATQAATQDAQATTQAASQAPATTAPGEETTAPDETKREGKYYPSNVIGFFYDYAQKVLEDEGFNVVIGEFNYSDYYEYGYVIGMNPDGTEELEAGSTIVLEVSAGLNNPVEYDENGDSDSSQGDGDNSENNDSNE